MKVKFVGAVGKVTGSCAWCIHPRTGAQFLVDCGVVQGGMNEEAENNMPFPFDPRCLKFVLLTHAHMDHCGRIPQLYEQGFRGKVICTSATARLAELQLSDSHNQAKKRGKHHKETDMAFPLYPGQILLPRPHRDWFYPIDRRRENFAFGTPLPVDDDLFVSFRRSSHMLGCCSITILWSPTRDFRKSICFSGDIGPVGLQGNQGFVLERNQIPHLQCPYLVVESTYGNKPRRESKHKNFAQRWGELRKIVSKYRTIVIPCFSMHRTQEILIDLWGALRHSSGKPEIPEMEFILDSPLAKSACAIFRDELKKGAKGGYLSAERQGIRGGRIEDIDKALLGSPDWIFEKKIRTARKGMDSNEGAVFDPSDGKKRVIVVSSGMCHTGPVLNYLQLLQQSDAAFILTGFQNTHNGKQLQELAKKQEGSEEGAEDGEEIRLFTSDREDKGQKFRVCAGVFNLGPYYSGHADIDILLEYILDIRERMSLSEEEEDDNGASDPRELPNVTVFLNHGDNRARANLRKKILAASAEEAHYHRKISKVEIPHMTSPFFDLERGEWEEPPSDLVRKLIKTLSRRENALRPKHPPCDKAKKPRHRV